jgi:hypothetical protein
MNRQVVKTLLSLLTLWASAVPAAAPERFFDDFSYADTAAMAAKGWTPREKAGHPGVEGATWSAAQFRLLDDPLSQGNRLLRLTASTDGTGVGTTQAQLCHARKYLEGTYAARIRFSDQPVAGVDGDPVIQTFYAVTPLKHDFDPDFSEMDWEYLPNGGWGSEKTRLYGIAWQTVQLNPWQAHNQQHEEFGSLEGWHQLMMQVSEGKVKLFLDGRQIATHGGRTYPVSPMSINFNLWFSPGGLLAKTEQARRYEQDVDWVFHARNEVLSPAQVNAEVAKFRTAGIAQTDNVPAAKPALSSLCDF